MRLFAVVLDALYEAKLLMLYDRYLLSPRRSARADELPKICPLSN